MELDIMAVASNLGTSGALLAFFMYYTGKKDAAFSQELEKHREQVDRITTKFEAAIDKLSSKIDAVLHKKGE